MQWIKIDSSEFRLETTSGKWAEIYYDEMSLSWTINAGRFGYTNTDELDDAKAIAESLITTSLDVMRHIVIGGDDDVVLG